MGLQREEQVKVKKLIAYLNTLNPEEHIAVLWWERNLFTVSENDELPSDQVWEDAVQELYEWEEAGNGVCEFLQDAINEKHFRLQHDIANS